MADAKKHFRDKTVDEWTMFAANLAQIFVALVVASPFIGKYLNQLPSISVFDPYFLVFVTWSVAITRWTLFFSSIATTAAFRFKPNLVQRPLTVLFVAFGAAACWFNVVYSDHPTIQGLLVQAKTFDELTSSAMFGATLVFSALAIVTVGIRLHLLTMIAYLNTEAIKRLAFNHPDKEAILAALTHNTRASLVYLPEQYTKALDDAFQHKQSQAIRSLYDDKP